MAKPRLNWLEETANHSPHLLLAEAPESPSTTPRARETSVRLDAMGRLIHDLREVQAFRGKEARLFFSAIPEAPGPERDRAVHEFILRNTPLVLHLVKPWVLSAERVGLMREDLVNEGVMSLFRAMEKYDPRVGEFSTYAKTWIVAFVRQAIQNHDHRSGIGAGASVKRLAKRIARIQRENVPTHLTLEEIYEIIVEEIRGTRRNKGRDPEAGPFPSLELIETALFFSMEGPSLSLDQPVGHASEEVSMLRGALIPDQTTCWAPDELAAMREEFVQMGAIFVKLFRCAEQTGGRILEIIRGRYPMDRLENTPYRAIGEPFGVSHEAIRQSESNWLLRNFSVHTGALQKQREHFVRLGMALGAF